MIQRQGWSVSIEALSAALSPVLSARPDLAPSALAIAAVAAP
jgi:hypothetical protein